MHRMGRVNKQPTAASYSRTIGYNTPGVAAAVKES